VALPIVLIPLWYGGLWAVGLAVAVSLLAGHELYNLMERGRYRPARWIGFPWLVLLVLTHADAYFAWSTASRISWFSPTLLATIGLILALTYSLFQTDHPMNTWMSTSTGALYTGVLIGQFLGLRLLEDGFWWLLLGLILTWTNDTVAYLVGSAVGEHKLWPRISPKKSWEGTLAGWASAAIAGAVFVQLTPLSIPMATAIFLGLVSGVLALLGDLSVSMLKRQVGVKDSGRLLPGHGGILDRLDSLLFVIPFIYQSALLIG
jgi:phosphatidate cytidylyltransferase